MNFIPGRVDAHGMHLGDRTLSLPPGRTLRLGETKLGIRPEYLALVDSKTAGAVPATVLRVQDVGTHVMLSADFAGTPLKSRLSADVTPLTSGDTVWLQVMGEHTCFYQNEEIVA